LDADQHPFIDEALPSNAWLTDLRDAEGYVLTEENVDVVLRLGCGIERVSARSIIGSMQNIAKYLAAVRLASYSLELRLPVSEVKLGRYISSTRDGVLRLNERKLLDALLTAAGISLRQLDTMARAVSSAIVEISSTRLDQVVHGKDCIKLLTIQFRALGASDVVDAGPLLWSSFKRERVAEFPVLNEVVNFLIKA